MLSSIFERTPPPRRTSRLTNGLAAAGATAALYGLAICPWQRRWGTTRAEARRPLPGDALVPRPDYETTRAITIEAPPEAVWPWLVQLGQGRGGFYSYDWLENAFGLNIHSSDHIEPNWQTIEPGDAVRMAPADRFDGAGRMDVALVEAERALVLRSPADAPPDQAASWAFVLAPVDDTATRLLVRLRLRAPLAMRLMLDPAHFIMERKMLYGIKHRAEQAVSSPAPDDD
jgi:hypothetical protein